MIKDKVRQYLMETVTYGAPIEGDDTPLVESGFLDSFGSFDLAVFIEQTFDIVVPSTEITMENFGTFNKIELYVITKQAKANEKAA